MIMVPFSPFKLKINYTPPFPQGSHIQLFVRLVEWDLHALWERRGGKEKSFSLTYAEWRALEEWRRNKSLIVKPADKDGNIVLMERPFYLKMCYDILSNEENDELLQKDQLMNTWKN